MAHERSAGGRGIGRGRAVRVRRAGMKAGPSVGGSAGAEPRGVGLVVLCDQQAEMCREVCAARRLCAAEQPPAARGAPALFVWPVLVEYCLQGRDDTRQFAVRDAGGGRRVGGLPSPGEISQVAVK